MRRSFPFATTTKEEEEGGGRTGHAWRKHGGKRMRWSDKRPPTFDHRLVSWIHFNAPYGVSRLVLFYELSIAGDVAVKMEEAIEINFSFRCCGGNGIVFIPSNVCFLGRG